MLEQQKEKIQDIQTRKNTVFKLLNKYQNTKDTKYLDKALNYINIDKDTVVDVLKKFPNLVKWCDEAYSGWGNGGNKRSLISPIIEAIADKAEEMKISEKIINEFKSKCYKELNAVIYTDEQVIIKEVDKMLNLLK